MKVEDIVYTFDEFQNAIAEIEVIGIFFYDESNQNLEEWKEISEKEIKGIKKSRKDDNWIKGRVLKSSNTYVFKKDTIVEKNIFDEVYFTLEDVKKVMMSKYEKNLDKAIKKLSK